MGIREATPRDEETFLLEPEAAGVVECLSRFRAKNGIQDLEKARHYLDLLIEAESIDR